MPDTVGAPPPETVNVTSPPPGVEQTSAAPVSNDLIPPPDAASGGGLALSPSTGASPNNAQPAAGRDKESFVQGLKRGAHGETYLVDKNGSVVNARTTAPSAGGTFGSILGGIVMGALAGASKARPGGIPSSELGGGAGAGVGAAVEGAQERDIRNRGQAQQQFANQQVVQKMSREQAESQAQIAHLSADSERIRQATKFADDEHSLIMKAKELGLTEQATKIQQMSTDLQKSAFEMMETAAKYGIDPSIMLTSFTDAHPHAKDIASGKSAALYNGVPYTEEGHGSGIFDPQQLRNIPLLKPETFSTWTQDKDGNPVEKLNTLNAGTSALDYISAKMMGMAQLERMQSLQKVKLATDLNKAEVKEKTSMAAKNYSEAAMTGEQVKMMKSMGAQVPAGYKNPEGAFTMDAASLKDAITKSGATVPGDFEAMYAIGHYDADIKNPPSGLRHGVPQRDRTSALNYIRTFINPNFDENRYEAIKTLEKSAASGKDAQGYTSFSTAIDHLDQYHTIMQQLANGQVPAWNDIANKLSAATGHAVKPNAEAIKGVLVGETARLMKNAAPDVAEMATIGSTLSTNSSPEQIEGVTKAYAHAMMSKGNENLQRYYAWTGKLPPYSLSNNAREALKKWGIDPNEGLPSGGTDAGQGASAPTAKPAAAPATPLFASAPGKPRMMSTDGGKTWQTAPAGQ